jgi:hypothetical protein
MKNKEKYKTTKEFSRNVGVRANTRTDMENVM